MFYSGVVISNKHQNINCSNFNNNFSSVINIRITILVVVCVIAAAVIDDDYAGIVAAFLSNSHGITIRYLAPHVKFPTFAHGKRLRHQHLLLLRELIILQFVWTLIWLSTLCKHSSPAFVHENDTRWQNASDKKWLRLYCVTC